MTNLQKIPLREEKSDKKLQKVIWELETDYGTEIIDWISTIDYYQRMYFSNQQMLKGLYEAYDAFKKDPSKKNELTAKLDDVDYQIKTIDCLENDFLDFTDIRKLIGNLSIVFALNEPARQQYRREQRQESNPIVTDKQ